MKILLTQAASETERQEKDQTPTPFCQCHNQAETINVNMYQRNGNMIGDKRIRIHNFIKNEGDT